MKVRKVCGVGINDADYPVAKWESRGITKGKRSRKLLWICPFYRTWFNMIQRCYNEDYKTKHQTYKDCVVCEDWLIFSKFKTWMEQQDWNNKQLDKDLLIRDNKVYSPENCVFVSSEVNLFITESNAIRGLYPIGVCLLRGRFRAQINLNGNKKIVGTFKTPEDAHKAWLEAKLELAKEIAARQTDERVAKALIERYENYKA